jgi:hypothetical protein
MACVGTSFVRKPFYPPRVLGASAVASPGEARALLMLFLPGRYLFGRKPGAGRSRLPYLPGALAPALRQQDNHRHRYHPRCGSHCYSPRGIRRDSRRGRCFDRSRSDPSNPGSRGWPSPRQEHGSPRDRFLALHAGPASRHRDTHFDVRTAAPRRHCRVDSNRRHPTARVPVRLARA